MKEITNSETYAAPICMVFKVFSMGGLLEGSFANEQMGEEFDLFTE